MTEVVAEASVNTSVLVDDEAPPIELHVLACVHARDAFVIAPTTASDCAVPVASLFGVNVGAAT